jgi:hypothetical protein
MFPKSPPPFTFPPISVAPSSTQFYFYSYTYSGPSCNWPSEVVSVDAYPVNKCLPVYNTARAIIKSIRYICLAGLIFFSFLNCDFKFIFLDSVAAITYSDSNCQTFNSTAEFNFGCSDELSTVYSYMDIYLSKDNYCSTFSNYKSLVPVIGSNYFMIKE